ncbi:ATP-binding cassette domain-containing protein [Patescibacteria group bacterium]
MIKVTNLTKTYDRVKALDNVSFEVQKGKVTGFLGPNGAGKTTAMRIATGFLSADSGKVEFDKKNIQTNPNKIVTNIGYLPENNPLYRNLRVDELLTFTAKMKGITNKKEIKSLVKKCGLTRVMRKEIDTLSKGFKQRVGLAKALIGNPKYLILDEPTEGLDPNQKEEILKLIKSFAKDKTIIFSSHVLSEVTQVADNVIIINKGKIVAEGNKDVLVKKHFKGAIISLKTNAPATQLAKVIGRINGVNNISKLSNGKSKFSEYEISCSNPEDVALETFNQVARNKWELIELHTKSQGLEELFKDLTK